MKWGLDYKLIYSYNNNPLITIFFQILFIVFGFSALLTGMLISSARRAQEINACLYFYFSYPVKTTALASFQHSESFFLAFLVSEAILGRYLHHVIYL